MNKKEQDESDSQTDIDSDLLSDNQLQGSDSTYRRMHDMLLEIRNFAVTKDDCYLEGVEELRKMTKGTTSKQKADANQIKISPFF